MSVLIREVKVLDSSSPHHKKTLNVFIKDGVIQAIDKVNHRADTVIEGKGSILTQGWLDLNVHFNDPGLEYKEDVLSGCQLAAASGYTAVATLPNTEPVVQSKSQVEYLTSKSRGQITELLPIAAVTLETKGEDLTEMIDLHHAGAIAFSDGQKPLWHTDILLKSLIYLQKFDGLLINKPEDQMLTRFGNMNEGVASTMLGLRGMPALAEHLTIKRDLDVLSYANGKIHFSNISSAESVKLIKSAKKKGLNVSCDVSIHHLLYTDQRLMTYDSNFKSNPPFREERDRKALIKAVKEGTIDAITSSHCPQDEESKKLEFDKAEFGLIGLQTMLPSLIGLGNELDLEDWLPKVTSGPRHLLKRNNPSIEENQKANLTLFDPKANWSYNDQTNLSKSKNSPLLGQQMTGKVAGVFREDMHQTF